MLIFHKPAPPNTIYYISSDEYHPYSYLHSFNVFEIHRYGEKIKGFISRESLKEWTIQELVDTITFLEANHPNLTLLFYIPHTSNEIPSWVEEVVSTSSLISYWKVNIYHPGFPNSSTIAVERFDI